jgi:hypothetical protein
MFGSAAIAAVLGKRCSRNPRLDGVRLVQDSYNTLSISIYSNAEYEENR